MINLIVPSNGIVVGPMTVCSCVRIPLLLGRNRKINKKRPGSDQFLKITDLAEKKTLVKCAT